LAEIGKNISVEVKGDKAVITIDLTKRGGLSSSGKSVIVATTSGNVPIPGTNIVLGLNAYVKANGK
jgi:hypothetical protein